MAQQAAVLLVCFLAGVTAEYELGTYDSNDCASGDSSIITSKEECETAQKWVIANTKASVKVENDPNYPRGCYYHDTSAEHGAFFFNTHKAGGGNALARTICMLKAEGSSSAAPQQKRQEQQEQEQHEQQQQQQEEEEEEEEQQQQQQQQQQQEQQEQQAQQQESETAATGAKAEVTMKAEQRHTSKLAVTKESGAAPSKSEAGTKAEGKAKSVHRSFELEGPAHVKFSIAADDLAFSAWDGNRTTWHGKFGGGTTPLLEWFAADGASVSLSAEPFRAKNAWINRLVLKRDEVTLLDIMARKTHFGTLQVVLDGVEISHPTPVGVTNTYESAHPGFKLTTAKRKGDRFNIGDLRPDVLSVAAGGLKLEISSSKAEVSSIPSTAALVATSTANEDLHHMHLNINIDNGLPKDGEGFFAELAGVRQMSALTKMLVEKRVVKRDPSQAISSKKKSSHPAHSHALQHEEA
jgi:flagellar motor protein MotB